MRRWEDSAEGKRLAGRESDMSWYRNKTATQHTVKLNDGTDITTFFGPKPVVGTRVYKHGADGELAPLRVVHDDYVPLPHERSLELDEPWSAERGESLTVAVGGPRNEASPSYGV